MALVTKMVDMDEVQDLSSEVFKLFADHNPPMAIATLATAMTLVRLFAGQQDIEMEPEKEIKHIQDIITMVDAMTNPVQSELVH